MALDVAMGGSTNTVLHILAAAQEGEVDFDLAAIDAVSRRVPCLAKVAPNSDYHMEDVHRAGGIPAILGELRRAGLLHEDVHTVHSPSLAAWLDAWDVRAAAPSAEAVELFHAAPGGVRTTEAFSTEQPLVGARHRRGRAAASATSSTRTRATAGWPCCAATSPPTARSSSPPGSTRSSSTSRARRGSSRARRRPSR